MLKRRWIFDILIFKQDMSYNAISKLRAHHFPTKTTKALVETSQSIYRFPQSECSELELRVHNIIDIF